MRFTLLGHIACIDDLELDYVGVDLKLRFGGGHKPDGSLDLDLSIGYDYSFDKTTGHGKFDPLDQWPLKKWKGIDFGPKPVDRPSGHPWEPPPGVIVNSIPEGSVPGAPESAEPEDTDVPAISDQRIQQGNEQSFSFIVGASTMSSGNVHRTSSPKQQTLELSQAVLRHPLPPPCTTGCKEGALGFPVPVIPTIASPAGAGDAAFVRGDHPCTTKSDLKTWRMPLLRRPVSLSRTHWTVISISKRLNWWRLGSPIT